MSELVLYAESTWQSPWVFHVLVALEELAVPYTLELLPLPIPPADGAKLRTHALLGKVPVLVDGPLWLSESSAITEYLAERFAPPKHPRIMPADPVERARARQIMSWLRTGLMGLREERPTTSVFSKSVRRPLGERARADAAELVGVAERLLASDRQTLFRDWSVADTDLALALMRLVANEDPTPPRVSEYALAQFARPSVRNYVSQVPTTR
jgi:glutathione S-transferase